MNKHRLLLFNIISIIIIIINFSFIINNLQLILPRYVLTLNLNDEIYQQLESIIKDNKILRNKEVIEITKVERYEEFPNGDKIVIYYNGTDGIPKEIDLAISSKDDLYSFMKENEEEDIRGRVVINTTFIITIILVVICILFNIIIFIKKFILK